jgi:hypothetical protein
VRSLDDPEKVVFPVSTSFRRKPESIDIRMLEIPDQAQNDRPKKTFYDFIFICGHAQTTEPYARRLHWRWRIQAIESLAMIEDS